MIKITSYKLIKAINFLQKKPPQATSFFIFIIFRDEECAKNKTILNHESIHFIQQLEMLFVFHWLAYLLYYLIGRMKGLPHDAAYRKIPFEIEAYANQKNFDYNKTRKPYSWLKYR